VNRLMKCLYKYVVVLPVSPLLLGSVSFFSSLNCQDYSHSLTMWSFLLWSSMQVTEDTVGQQSWSWSNADVTACWSCLVAGPLLSRVDWDKQALPRKLDVSEVQALRMRMWEREKEQCLPQLVTHSCW
jgi:hypothetical protein